MRMREKELQEFLIFTGHFVRDDEYVYVVCDQVPHLTIPGRTEEEADKAMDTALEMYISMLAERGELERAVKEYGIQVISVESPRFRPIRWHHTETLPPGKTFRRLVPA